MAHGRSFSPYSPSTFVKLSTDDGLIGYGECTPLGPAYMPSYAEGVRAGLRVLGPAYARDRAGPSGTQGGKPGDGLGDGRT